MGNFLYVVLFFVCTIKSANNKFQVVIKVCVCVLFSNTNHLSIMLCV